MTAWALERGATVLADGRTRFAVWAPHAERVSLRLAAGSARAEHPLAPSGDGVFETVVGDAPPGTDYLYRLDDRHDYPDPVSRHQPSGVHGPSRVVDPGAFRWTDHGWTGVEMADLVCYELHVGTFSPPGTFAAAAERFPALRELGVTAIELMPVAEFPGGRNWGYDGAHPYAPQSTYGGPDGLRRLVDAAHAAGLAVLIDVVYNHLGPEGNYLARFGPYFNDRYQTPWGPAINFDGPDSDPVRRYFLDNALYWVTEFHADGLRLDAVHAIMDLGARHILAELADLVRAQAAALGRRVLVIAESALNDPRLVRPPAGGGYGLEGQWNDDFHHAVHATLTGERAGYYVDFGGPASLAKALRERFVLDGRYSAFHRRRHGAPAADVPADRFVVSIQTHDQVGNRALGERLAALVSFEARKLAAALLLLSPYVPLLFMGEEYGETNPFLYFVSHGDPVLVAAVRDGRRREFGAFDWQTEIPDPQAEETFVRSRLGWEWEQDAERQALRMLYRDLIAVRRAEPALRPGTARTTVAYDEAAGWVTLGLTRAGAPCLFAAFNVGGTAAAVPGPPVDAVGWTLLVATGERRYRGPVSAVRHGDGQVLLPPWSAALLRGGLG